MCSPPPPRLEWHNLSTITPENLACGEPTRERQNHDGDDAEEERKPSGATDCTLGPPRRCGIVLGSVHFVGVEGLLGKAGFSRLDFNVHDTPEEQLSGPLEGLGQTGP